MIKIFPPAPGIRTLCSGRRGSPHLFSRLCHPYGTDQNRTSGISWYRRAVLDHLFAGKAAYFNLQRSVTALAVLTFLIPAISFYRAVRAFFNFILKRALSRHLHSLLSLRHILYCTFRYIKPPTNPPTTRSPA